MNRYKWHLMGVWVVLLSGGVALVVGRAEGTAVPDNHPYLSIIRND